ncbi:hypothetical protein IPG36_07900 [bacterium]|nr:MAG: hypothetical protein IPG36_07900 [bacterium]
MLKKFLRALTKKRDNPQIAGGQRDKLNRYVDLLVTDYGETLRLLSKE